MFISILLFNKTLCVILVRKQVSTGYTWDALLQTFNPYWGFKWPLLLLVKLQCGCIQVSYNFKFLLPEFCARMSWSLSFPFRSCNAMFCTIVFILLTGLTIILFVCSTESWSDEVLKSVSHSHVIFIMKIPWLKQLQQTQTKIYEYWGESKNLLCVLLFTSCHQTW